MNKDWSFWKSWSEKSNANRSRNLAMLLRKYLSFEGIMRSITGWSTSTCNPSTVADIPWIHIKTSMRLVRHFRMYPRTFRIKMCSVRHHNCNSRLLTCSLSKTNNSSRCKCPPTLWTKIKMSTSTGSSSSRIRSSWWPQWCRSITKIWGVCGLRIWVPLSRVRW